ncbi:MAG: hypothetical protein MMC33_002301 [Icmadophila ericetorum]|nr:hypothetical protein [Icmadophila ericetorum]
MKLNLAYDFLVFACRLVSVILAERISTGSEFPSFIESRAKEVKQPAIRKTSVYEALEQVKKDLRNGDKHAVDWKIPCNPHLGLESPWGSKVDQLSTRLGVRNQMLVTGVVKVTDEKINNQITRTYDWADIEICELNLEIEDQSKPLDERTTSTACEMKEGPELEQKTMGKVLWMLDQ